MTANENLPEGAKARAFYIVWIGGYALAAYAINDPLASALFVLFAGAAWPVRQWWKRMRA